MDDLLVHKRTYNGLPCGVGFVEESVEVRQESVTYLQVMFGALHQHWVGTVKSGILGLEAENQIKAFGLMNGSG